MPRELRDETLYATDGAFLAAMMGIDIDSNVGGLKSVLGEVSLMLLALKRIGTVFINAYRGLEKLELAAGESYVLDNQHLIAWDDEIDYETRRVGDLKSTPISGERLAVEFTGSGTAWYQTRDLDSFVGVLAPRMPPQT